MYCQSIFLSLFSLSNWKKIYGYCRKYEKHKRVERKGENQISPTNITI